MPNHIKEMYEKPLFPFQGYEAIIMLIWQKWLQGCKKLFTWAEVFLISDNVIHVHGCVDVIISKYGKHLHEMWKLWFEQIFYNLVFHVMSLLLKKHQKSFKMKNVHVLHLFTSLKYLVFLPGTLFVGNEFSNWSDNFIF